MRVATIVLGLFFVVVGAFGFDKFNDNFANMHLSATHNVLLLITGILALWFGITKNDRALRMFCRVAGIIWGLVGLVGLFFGPDMFTLKNMVGEESSHVWKLIPGALEFGSGDDKVHLVTGILLLIAGFLPLSLERRIREEKPITRERLPV